MSEATEQQVLDEMEQEGFTVLPWRLEPDFHRALLAAVEEAWEKAQADGPLESLHKLSIMGDHPAFPPMVEWPPLLRVVHDLLTNNIYMNHSHLDVHPPHQPTTVSRWHRDGGVQGSDMKLMPDKQPRLTIKVGVFLTDVLSPEHGTLDVVPRSHKDPVLRDASKDQPDAHSIVVPAGSVALFDARVMHRRHDNLTGGTRKALFMAYTYRWTTSRERSYTDLPEWPTWSALRRQLLGDSTWEPFYPRRQDLPLYAWRQEAGPAPDADPAP